MCVCGKEKENEIAFPDSYRIAIPLKKNLCVPIAIGIAVKKNARSWKIGLGTDNIPHPISSFPLQLPTLTSSSPHPTSRFLIRFFFL
jgi:hypothetical protein